MNLSKLTVQKMIAVTAMAMAIPMSAYAGHHEEGGSKQHSEMHHYKHGGMGMLKQLDLSEAQQAQVKQIMDKQRAEMKAAMGDRRAHREEMKTIVEQDTFDAAKAERLIAQQQEQERATKLSMLRTQHEIYKLLTPEQREKAKVIRAEWKEKMKDRYNKRKGDSASNAM
jgi:periplasmic protein CpxP/Spy